jgi:hypothetical protein
MTATGAFAAVGVVLVVGIGVLGWLAQGERTGARQTHAPPRAEPYRFGTWFYPRSIRRDDYTAAGWRYVQITRLLTLLFWATFAVWLVLRLAG